MRARVCGVVAAAAAFAALALFVSVERESPDAKPDDAAHVRSSAPLPERIRIARIELPPDPAPEPPPQHPPTAPPARAPRPLPPPAKLAPARAAPAPVPSPPVSAQASRSGRFPRMRATYHRIGFAAYRDAVQALGGRFYLYDPVRREPVAEVDPRSGAPRAAPLESTLSRWPRDVTRHVPTALEKGRARFGSRVTRVVLLPPARLDLALLDGLERGLRERGIDPGAVVRVDLAYEIRAGRLGCELLAAALRDGRETPLGLHVDLTGGGRT